ncbi:DUF4238 domain-containing protein [Roseibium aggregatum]|uniref:DUF4238 domain-containing protein n=1 Tax=Roseibium aggregatum TaxID=187304 RepID=A0A926NX83_9HYPH|nr:DUF4238 domain-containing protein [Roseibium aggregatum]MBD1545315.1 DUF4238 domain-containing protein [Roseibium aggregatum]
MHPTHPEDPKKHHYIPVCYSKNFTDKGGYIHLVDTWNQNHYFPQKPEKALAINYLYRQPDHAEQRFDTALEKGFSNYVESAWTPAFERLKRKEPVSAYDWVNIVKFICSLHTRTPIVLDAILFLLRESVIGQYEETIGLASDDPNLKIFCDMYRERNSNKSVGPIHFSNLVRSGIIDLNIDPHRRLSSMPLLVNNIDIFQENFAFGGPFLIHNITDLPFISSDNPVCYFNRNRTIKESVPYSSKQAKNFIFIFPISSNIAIVNNNFIKTKERHVTIDD